jgi:hypothetical protein
MQTTVTLEDYLREELRERSYAIRDLAKKMGGDPNENERRLEAAMDIGRNAPLGKDVADQIGHALNMDPPHLPGAGLLLEEPGVERHRRGGNTTVFTSSRSLREGEEIVAWQDVSDPYQP